MLPSCILLSPQAGQEFREAVTGDAQLTACGTLMGGTAPPALVQDVREALNLLQDAGLLQGGLLHAVQLYMAPHVHSRGDLSQLIPRQEAHNLPKDQLTKLRMFLLKVGCRGVGRLVVWGTGEGRR